MKGGQQGLKLFNREEVNRHELTEHPSLFETFAGPFIKLCRIKTHQAGTEYLAYLYRDDVVMFSRMGHIVPAIVVNEMDPRIVHPLGREMGGNQILHAALNFDDIQSVDVMDQERTGSLADAEPHHHDILGVRVEQAGHMSSHYLMRFAIKSLR